jgi:hypothetical protein
MSPFPRTPEAFVRRYGVVSCDLVKGALLGINVRDMMAMIAMKSININM